MKVTDIRVKRGTNSELDATVNAISHRKSFRLFYRFPTEFAKSVQVSADPFIAALLLPSMEIGEPLIVDAPAAPRLLRTLPKIMSFCHDWDSRYKIIEVRTSKERKESDSISKAKSLFFSAGLDSFYALTKLTEQTAERNDLSHLIFVHGFDIKLNDNMLFDRSYAAVKDIASYYGKKLVLVSTNIREIADKYVSWGNCYGAGMASVALCFNGFFGQVYIASDLGPYEAKRASHRDLGDKLGNRGIDLDPLWSTQTTNIIHCYPGISRIEKAKAIANNPMAQKHLRVCWENRNGAYNCGSCSKCIRTMLALYLADALSNFNFPTKLTPELIKGVDYGPDPNANLHRKEILDEIAHELQRRGEHQLANAVSQTTKKPPAGRSNGLKYVACKTTNTDAHLSNDELSRRMDAISTDLQRQFDAIYRSPPVRLYLALKRLLERH